MKDFFVPKYFVGLLYNKSGANEVSGICIYFPRGLRLPEVLNLLLFLPKFALEKKIVLESCK